MIEIKECSKSYGKIQAVNQVTLDVGEHEVFGLVGSNGAGKAPCFAWRQESSSLTKEKFWWMASLFMTMKMGKKISFIFRMTFIFLQIIHQKIWQSFMEAIIAVFRKKDFMTC